MQTFLTGLAAALALHTHAVAGTPENPPAPRPIYSDGVLDAAAEGVWQAHAQGWIIEIGSDGITRWQDTPAGCYATAPAGPDMPLMGQVEYTLFAPYADRSHAGFQYLPGDQTTPFERLDALPARCGANNLSSETGVFEVFASVMERHYAFFDVRGIDWAARVADARPQVQDGMGEAALRDVLASMLEGLSDSHTKLIGTADGERFRIQDGQGETLPRIHATSGESPWLIGLIDQLQNDVLDPGSVFTANDRILWGTIGRRTGYILVFTMGGFVDNGVPPGSAEWGAQEIAAFDAVFDEALGAFSGMDRVIVDLSNNRGGYDKIARMIASRFAAETFTAYTMDTDRDGEPDHVYEIAPSDGERFTGPVTVLTSDVTVSGGEIATLSLRQLPNVTHAGQATRGSFSTPLAKPLPNGWYLELSSEVFTAPDGAVFEETGIPPDITLPVYPPDAPVAGHAAALQAIAAGE
ncbi:peptidase [Glycocaulis albus]|uniref:Peptidase n=1 Tax=Glycocaulis albus TaxID=1382801 RepID=A0ABQ1XRY7_9PROT|nr:S41 family peptidase [Glycocaulis albus]MBV5259371.1 S41 family peptidase [Synechococcus moorigangaii CMS01]GGH01565.1 peptidase [Glycocaulis albus]